MSLEVPTSRHGSSRAGSASSGLRLADRWHYDFGPPIPDQSGHHSYLILDSKLRPRPDGHRDKSNTVSHGAHRVKRELSEDSYTSRTMAKNRKVSNIAVELRRADPARASSTVSYETDAGASFPETRNQLHDTPNNTESHHVTIPRSKAISNTGLLRRKNDLLKRENDLLNTHRDRKMAALEDDVIRLKEANKGLTAMLGRLRDIESARSHGSGGLIDEVKELTAKLKQRDEEIDEKIRQIAELDEQLSAQVRFQTTIEDLELDITCSSSFSKGLAELEQGTRRVARFLVQSGCLSSHQITKLQRKPRRQPELDSFIRGVLGKLSFLVSSPDAAMRALVFGFVRNRIFFSDCWRALYFEGYMLRELQQVIHKTTPAGILESFHRAALESMLSNNHQFGDCWIQTEVEDAIRQFLELFSPLLNHQEFDDIKDQINRELGIIFTGAFKSRARFVPPRGFRYELVQFKPGDKFDPAYMQAQGPASKDISVPSDGSVYRIKVCTHGCLVEHSVKTESSCADIVQVLSQPFIANDESFDLTNKGTLKSDKAIVILEDVTGS